MSVIDAAVRTGRRPDVGKPTGRPARSFAAFAEFTAEHAGVLAGRPGSGGPPPSPSPGRPTAAAPDVYHRRSGPPRFTAGSAQTEELFTSPV
ncbi:hypothetical protein AB0C76_36845 [Kitasatospora sp. NPDC048722]|uniref:hypothetical protein n=1 Tax=Kitasatospora sp. NPDC048722 TaxID=3155639 RepID=UPI0033C9A25D